MVKNPLPSNAGDAGSIPGQETKIPCATMQLSPLTAKKTPHATTKTQCRQIRKEMKFKRKKKVAKNIG